MNDEYNKGYNSAGPQRSYEARQGQLDRREKEQMQRQAAERATREQQWRDHEQRTRAALPGAAKTSGGLRQPQPASPPMTWQSAVRDFAGLGAVLLVIYSVFTQSLITWELLFGWAIKGALAGAVVGIVVYVAVLALRLGAIILTWAIKIAFGLFLLYIGLLVLRDLF